MDTPITTPHKGLTFLLVLIAALGIGGSTYFYTQIQELKAVRTAEDSNLKDQQAKQILLKILEEKDASVRSEKLMALRNQLLGSGLETEDLVTEELIKSLNTSATYNDVSLEKREQSVNQLVQTIRESQSRLSELETDINNRQRVLADKEAAANIVLEREKDLEERKTELKLQQQKLHKYEEQLALLQKRLDLQLLQMDAQAKTSAAKQDELLQQIAELEAKQNEVKKTEVVVVPQPVEPTSTTVIRESYPVYVDLWGNRTPYRRYSPDRRYYYDPHKRPPSNTYYWGSRSKGFGISIGSGGLDFIFKK